METNELRLGNFIYDKKDENLEYVYELYDLGDRISINHIDPDLYIPVPLTEKWITHLGFKTMPESESMINIFELDGFQLWNKNEDFSEIVYLGNRYPIEIKYVHQLQNLFFAIMGKEL